MLFEIVDQSEKDFVWQIRNQETKFLVLCPDTASFINTQIQIIELGLAHQALPIYLVQMSVIELRKTLFNFGLEATPGSSMRFERKTIPDQNEYADLEQFTHSRNPKIVILLRHWDAYELTNDCINDLKSTSYRNKQIVLLDDASVDFSYLKLFIDFPEVHIIRSLKKMEYCATFNLLAMYSEIITAEYLFILNNDTRGFSKDIFEELLLEFEDPSVGIVSSRVMDFNGNFRLKQDRTWLGIKFNIATEGYLIPTSIWRMLQGFNPFLIRYAEDLEFVYQLERLGYTQKRVDSVSFDHAGSGSSSRQNFVPVYYLVRNLIWIQKLYFPDDRIVPIVSRSFRKTWPAVLRRNSRNNKRYFLRKVFYLILGTFTGVFQELDVRPKDRTFAEYLTKSPLGFAQKFS